VLGIGEESGLHLSGEQTGNMPGPEWMEIHHPRERWSQAQTANVSIGQGYTLVSPLQLAMAYVAAANGGTCYYPRLVDKVLDQNDTPVVDEQGKTVNFAPRIRADLRNEVSPRIWNSLGEVCGKLLTKTGGPAAEPVWKTL
jgi:penicillin-binding protein 2